MSYSRASLAGRFAEMWVWVITVKASLLTHNAFLLPRGAGNGKKGQFSVNIYWQMCFLTTSTHCKKPLEEEMGKRGVMETAQVERIEFGLLRCEMQSFAAQFDTCPIK